MGADIYIKTRHEPIFPDSLKKHNIRPWKDDDGYWYYREGYDQVSQLGLVLGRDWFTCPLNTDSQRIKRLRNTVMKCSDKKIRRYCQRVGEPNSAGWLCAKRDYLKTLFNAGVVDARFSV